MKVPSALVTGAYGFIGRHVARALAARGYRVIGLGHGDWTREEWRRWGIDQWRCVDVSRRSLETYADEFELIVHCAGSASVPYSLSHPLEDFERTVATSMATLEFLRLHAPRARLVIPSSAGVYGAAGAAPIPTGAPLNPVSPYGVHKKVVEDLARCYARHFGLNLSIVRLFSIYGIGLRKQLLWDACSKFSRGEAGFAGTGAETRDWLHVEDAAALLVAAAEIANPACPVANGGSGVATTNADLLRRLADAMATGLSPSFSGQTRAGDPQHYQADLSEALAMQWRPQRMLNDELAAYADWCKRGAP